MNASSGGMLSLRASDPPVVAMSFVSKLSLISSGAQNSEGISSPAARATSISSARARAPGLISLIALMPALWSKASILSMYPCTTSRQEYAPARSDVCSSAMVTSRRRGFSVRTGVALSCSATGVGSDASLLQATSKRTERPKFKLPTLIFLAPLRLCGQVTPTRRRSDPCSHRRASGPWPRATVPGRKPESPFSSTALPARTVLPHIDPVWCA